MKPNSNPGANSNISFNENFDCNKMRLLIADDHNESFTERFRTWLKSYTRSAREKIWVDIESYQAG